MKVLHVNNNYRLHGGVEHYMWSVGDLLSRAGNQNAILYRNRHLTHTSDSPWPAYLVEENGRHVERQIRTILDREHFDIAYVHQVSSAEVIEMVSKMIPTVAYVHDFQAVCPGRAKLFRRGDRVCGFPFGWVCIPMHYVRRCSAARRPRTLGYLISQTRQLKKAYSSLAHILVATPYMRSLLLQNGFEPDRISLLAPHFLADDVPLESLPSEEPSTLLFAGRLEIEKGLPYLLRAFSRVSESARLIVAGDGTLRSVYEHIASDLGVADRVQFVGWLDNSEMRLAYQRCSLLVIPSIWPEPFAKVGIEALTYSRPVVAFDVGGISDWLMDGVNGFLVRPKDSNMLASRIESLLRDEGRRTAMGQAGRGMVTSRYTESRHVRALLSLFQSLQSA